MYLMYYNLLSADILSSAHFNTQSNARSLFFISQSGRPICEVFLASEVAYILMDGVRLVRCAYLDISLTNEQTGDLRVKLV